MDKITLAHKLTTETLKKYSIETLEEHYGLFGGQLIVAIFNEIHDSLTVTDPNEAVPVFFHEDIPKPAT